MEAIISTIVAVVVVSPWPSSWIFTSTASIKQQCSRQRAVSRFLQTGDKEVTEDDDFYEEDGREESNEEEIMKSFLQTKTADTARIIRHYFWRSVYVCQKSKIQINADEPHVI